MSGDKGAIFKSNLLWPFKRSPPKFRGSETGVGALTFCGGSGPDTQHTRCDKSVWKQDTEVIIYCRRPPVQPRGHLESNWLVPSVSCSWITVSGIPQLAPKGLAPARVQGPEAHAPMVSGSAGPQHGRFKSGLCGAVPGAWSPPPERLCAWRELLARGRGPRKASPAAGPAGGGRGASWSLRR